MIVAFCRDMPRRVSTDTRKTLNLLNSLQIIIISMNRFENMVSVFVVVGRHATACLYNYTQKHSIY